MKTADLIDIISQGSSTSAQKLRAFAPYLVLAVATSALMLVVGWGLRVDLAQVIQQPLVTTKNLLPLVTAIPLLWLLAQARHPEKQLKNKRLYVLPPVAIVVALVSVTLFQLPSEQWLSSIIGSSIHVCLLSIPVLSLPILGALFWLLRQGACSQPKATGAVVGIAAGCLAASVYALHCFEDSPAFYGVWYSSAIAFVGLLGATLGERYLKW